MILAHSKYSYLLPALPADGPIKCLGEIECASLPVEKISKSRARRVSNADFSLFIFAIFPPVGEGLDPKPV